MTGWYGGRSARRAGLSLFLLTLLFLLPLAAFAPAQAEPVSTVDVAGREVSLEAPAKHIVIGSSMNLDALSLAHPDPVSLIAGWSGLAASMDAAQVDALHELYPQIDTIPLIGRLGPDTLSLETLVTLQPDLVVLNLYDLAGSPASPDDDPLVARLTAAGLPVVIVDFFFDPLENSAPSLRALGDLLGTRPRVDEFLTFYDAHRDRITERLAAQDDEVRRPGVFLHAHAAGPDCCFSPGSGAFDGFIRITGGHNLAADILSAPTGQIALETLLTLQPDIYIATGGYARGSRSGFTLGREVSREEALAGFTRLLDQPGLSALDAVVEGHAYGLWHDFTHSPLHVVALEAMARWFHPELFADLDPADTLSEINERFLAIPLRGTFWIDASR